MNPEDNGRLLTEALTRIADRADPVHDPAGLAERALRRAGGRRRVRTAAALTAVAAATAPLLLLGGGETVRPAPPAATAAPDTAAADERRLVNACMHHGPPTGGMGGPHLLPKKGRPSDFRVLVSTEAGAETVAAVGSPGGFVLCAVQNELSTEPPYFLPWPGDISRGLSSFPGKLRVDSTAFLTRVGENGRGTSYDGLHHLVTGRFKPDVARIEVVWNRDRRADAVLRDGHFLARIGSRYAKTDDIDVMVRPQDRIRSITAFDAAGKVLQTWKAPGKGLRDFDSNTCRRPGAPALCSG
ncbi:hypothetical protein [Actinocorallia populi]|uniref:hypothetical protein n=1 Tax=Actinocorallia populi TaxID=2079200 RepID=UPI000D08870A|nr:hypothetical protein [Actinocorallia populi]